MAGQLLSLGIPNLKLLYEDEDMIGIVHILGTKYVIHSEYKKPITGALIKKAASISKLVDKTFKDKGVNFLYTWAQTPDEEKYNKFLGYEDTGNRVRTISDGGPLPDDYPLEVKEFIKCL